MGGRNQGKAEGNIDRKRKRTFRIELVTLSFETIEIVRFLTDLELEIMDMLHIVLPQTFALLHHRTLRRTALFSLSFATVRLDLCCRHFFWTETFDDSIRFFGAMDREEEQELLHPLNISQGSVFGPMPLFLSLWLYCIGSFFVF